MAETNDILEVAKMTISTSIKCNTVRGFIGWHSCDNICMDMHDVLDMCEDAFKRERYQESLEADTYVLVSGVKLASCADSSSGMLTDVIMRAFELIDLSTQTIAKLDAAMRKHALSLIIKEAKKKAFDGWDSWRYELLEKAVCLCDEKLAAKLEKLLDIFLEDIENDYMPEYKRQEDTILLKELKQCKYSVCYRSVLVKENEKKLLLEAVTENPYNLFYYAQFLVMDYPNEIYELCANYIREQCAQATDRRLYKKVCKDLLQLIKWKGNATAKLLVDEFKATYPRRSALLDELQKVEKKL